MNTDHKHIPGRLASFSIGALSICVLGLLGYIVFDGRSSDSSLSSRLTTPIPDSVNNRNLTLGGRVALESELRAYGEQATNAGTISDYSLYYQEFISGPVIAIQESKGFYPASLLKLPVALWYFREAQQHPGLLSEEIYFSGPLGVSIVHFQSVRTLSPGKMYTIEELIELMLTESDNDATNILVEYAGGREAINQVYEELDVRDVESYDTYLIDTQTYGAFFRVLFNARYLERASSERILEMLTHSSFRAGIVAQLPENVVVAHKFGERTLDEANTVRQLHECGIVYAPANPYLLCVMTQGRDYDEMAAFIAEVSHRIYVEASAPPS